ncbi:hypothetical protein [Paenibacillus sp. FSL R7-0273]|uniref:hypothetical protein n=1 Tax=Paenibacillus sp. FSL R7-0273 TaxID=1536772 RepID=UPI00063EE2D5|nr:hypothetical protein [Paenibacillus sp. FSL R7-0273]OMF95822.1 hypothetical protein BK144_04330 [Paenibacillus sp. FSL R7-0273]
MKKSMLATAASVLLLSASILGACSNNETANEAEPTASAPAATPVSEATASPEPTVSPAATAAPASASPEASAPASSERPQTQSFGEQEGGVPGQDGTLEQGDGYSLYIFDGYTFDAQTGRLSLTADSSYYAEIEPLPAGYDLAALKQQGQTELAGAKDYSGELFEHPLRFAELYLQVSNEKGTEDYMVWKNEAGDAYLLRIHTPEGDSADQFSPWTTVSLSTIEAE